MSSFKTPLLGAIFTLLSISTLAQDHTIGINTLDLNPNAVLQLVSPNGDQGLMIPKLSTSQRTDMARNLSNEDLGLLVFDAQLNKFFYWVGAWVDLSQSPVLTDGTMLTGDGVTNAITVREIPSENISVVPFGSVAATNLRDALVELESDVTANANGDMQRTVYDIDQNNTVDRAEQADQVNGFTVESSVPSGADFTDDQNISAGSGISVIPSGNDFTISNAAPDQMVSLADGGSGNVTIGGTYPNFTIDVASTSDADADPTNENQTVSAGSGISISQSGQDFEVTNAAPDQVVGLSDGGSGNVTIAGTYPNFTIDVPTMTDADADPTNENQTVSAGSGISISQSGQDFEVTNAAPDQVVGLSDGGSGNVTIGGTYPNFTIDVPTMTDADADPTNENQTVSAGSGISINQTGQDFEVTNAAPDQVVGLSDGGSGNVTIGGTYPNFTIDVPTMTDADADPTNENQTVSAGSGISINQTGQDFEVTNAAPDQVVGLSDGGSGNVTIGGTYPSFTVDVPSLNDADADPTNENQTVSAGSGISINQTGQDFEVTNASPDQVVGLSDGGSGNVTIGGTYPNFTIDVANEADPVWITDKATLASTGGAINTSGLVDWSQLKNVPPAIADGTDAVGLTAVTSTDITDNEIRNEDIFSGAAIDGTKINPNFGGQAITTTGIITADGSGLSNLPAPVLTNLSTDISFDPTSGTRLIGMIGTGAAPGSSLDIVSGDGTTSGGNLQLRAGHGDVGGFTRIEGGAGTNGVGGKMDVFGGQGENGDGGVLELRGGMAVDAGHQGGNVLISGGPGQAPADQGAVIINSRLQITDGTQQDTYVLTSDGAGNATWQAPVVTSFNDINSDITFAFGAARNINVASSTGNGDALTIAAGAGSAGAGGVLNLFGGNGSSVGGNVNIQGGSAPGEGIINLNSEVNVVGGDFNVGTIFKVNPSGQLNMTGTTAADYITMNHTGSTGNGIDLSLTGIGNAIDITMTGSGNAIEVGGGAFAVNGAGAITSTDLTFNAGAPRTIQVAAPTATGPGDDLLIQAADGDGDQGGTLELVGGSGIGGAGGDVSVVGGVGTNAGDAGGGVEVLGGSGNGAAGGNVLIRSGNGPTNGHVAINTNTAKHLVMDDEGNVGVGIFNPADEVFADLQVFNSDSATLKFVSNGSTIDGGFDFVLKNANMALRNTQGGDISMEAGTVQVEADLVAGGAQYVNVRRINTNFVNQTAEPDDYIVFFEPLVGPGNNFSLPEATAEGMGRKIIVTSMSIHPIAITVEGGGNMLLENGAVTNFTLMSFAGGLMSVTLVQVTPTLWMATDMLRRSP